MRGEGTNAAMSKAYTGSRAEQVMNGAAIIDLLILGQQRIPGERE